MAANSDIVEISDPERMATAPVVSVLMVTYNHEAWLGAAIESIVEQHFPDGFELVIGEDCSSDRTREIALDYQRRFPQLVRVITSTNNVGPAANHSRVVAAARGRYFAFCEGDDYWCHSGKLAAQVALLEADDDVAMVHTDWVRSRRGAGGGWAHSLRNSEHARLPMHHLKGDLFHAFYFGRILRTCTLMVRRSAFEAYKADPFSCGAYRFEDTVINAYLTSRWPVAYWPEVAAVYRESPGSLLRSGVASKIAFLRSSLHFDSDARQYFGNGDYPQAYRWELGVGMALWGLRARDMAVVRDALSDLARHFSVVDFIIAGWRTLELRLPRLRRRRGAPL